MQAAGASETAVWDPVERLDREALAEIQLTRLRETVARVLASQPRGAQLLAEAGITDAREIGGLGDIGTVPFMQKSVLRDEYPFGLLTVPREEIVRVHGSSGTHGKPTLVGYTRGDLDRWTGLMARCMTMAGVRPGMLIHNANGYGLFTGGFGFHQGAELIGATVVPVSGGFTARQAILLADLGPEVLVATPSYALAIAQAIAQSGVEPSSLRVRLGLFGGEPWTERLRDEVQRALPISAINFYGLSEMCGPGVAAECLHERRGLHVQEDHFLVEVIDPDSGEHVTPGEEGELVFTTLTKEALPLIRYRTGDLGSLLTEPCSCGRTFVRLIGLRGRRDDMLIVRGVNLHPSNVEHLLLGVAGVGPHYRLIVERTGALDELTLECEVTDGDGVVQGDARNELRERVGTLLREHTGLRIEVSLLDAGALPRSDGKAVRVIDRRT